MQITSQQLAQLKAHLTAYQLGGLTDEVEQVLRDAAASGAPVYSSSTFLHTDSLLQWVVVPAAPPAGDFALWLAADTDPVPLAQHFPQMLPYSPWGLVDAEPYPFPHLAGVALADAQWTYRYISAPGQWNAAPFKVVNEGFSGLASPVDEHGGLYYEGKLALPWSRVLPAGSGWAAPPLPEVAVSGYLDRQATLPQLRLRVPLLSDKTLGFGAGSVTLNLAVEAVTQLAPPPELPAELAGYRSSGSQKIGVVGSVKIGQADLTVAGYWPLDDDDDILLKLELDCPLAKLSTWFKTDSSENLSNSLTISPELTAGVQLLLSKQHATLKRMVLQFGLPHPWQLSSAGFSLALTSVAFETSIYPLASSTVALSRFAADALLGGTVPLRATGSYPNGEVSLGLVPGTAVPVSALVSALGLHLGDLLPGDLQLTELLGSYDFGRKYKSFSVALEQRAVSPGGPDATLHGFSLENIRLDIHGADAYVFQLSAVFSYTFGTANRLGETTLHFAGAAVYDAGWLLSFSYQGNVTLKQLGGAFGFGDLPEELDDFAFEELSFSLDVAACYKYFHGKAATTFLDTHGVLELSVHHGPTATDFFGTFTATIGGKPTVFAISYTKDNDEYELDVKLVFTVAGIDIKLEAVATGDGSDGLADKRFTGSAQGFRRHLRDALESLLEETGLDFIPEAMLPDLVLEGVYIDYTAPEINLVALTTISGVEINFFFQRQAEAEQQAEAKQAKAKRWAFGVDTTVDGLSALPLVGNELKSAKLLGVGFVYVSEAGGLQVPALSAGAERILVKPTDKPGRAYTSGFNLLGQVSLPLLAQPFDLLLPVSTSKQPASTTELTAPAAGEPPKTPVVPAVVVVAPAATGLATQPRPAVDPSEKWFELATRVGPVQLDRVGLAYKDGKLYLLLSLDLSLAGLVFSLDGLGIGFDPRELLQGDFKHPAFRFAGMGLSFQSGPVDISGAFVRTSEEVTDEQKQKKQVEKYDGSATIKFEQFTITGVGSYANVEGDPSLFIYALYEGELGGPEFFHVTGLAAGFGYNRKVNVPTFDKVARFPLVEMALSKEKKKLAEVLADLEKPDADTNRRPIEIARGENWLAVGVRFTSFEIVRGFLLLVAEFGHELQFSLLGLADLTLPLPPKDGVAPPPLVYLQLQMAAVLRPAEGYFSVAGSLTADSFVMTQDCHITGGFAYCMWFGSNPNAGQFVMTAGGYHPAFKAPDFYPQVPRLGYNWQVSGSVSIKGESYFAITPSCGMAGTSLEVLFESGDVKAWFIAHADMMVTWHPLSFVAEVSVEIGVSVRLNLLFCHKTVTISISAGLTLWGPPLGGRARIHVVIVTLEIGFGADQLADKSQPLSWDEFERLLPHADQSTATPTHTATPADAVCKLVAASGLAPQPKTEAKLPQAKDPNSDTPEWTVRAGSFSFLAQSAVPVSTLTFGARAWRAAGVVAADDTTRKVRKGDVQIEEGAGTTTELNIRPMDVGEGSDKSGASSAFGLTITRNGSKLGAADYAAWGIEPVRGKLAAALWGKPLREGDDHHFVQAPATPSNEVVDQLIGCRATTPAPRPGAAVGPIPLTALAFEPIASGGLTFEAARPAPDYQQCQPADPAAAFPLVAGSPARARLQAALARLQSGSQAVFGEECDELQALAAGKGALFRANPQLLSRPAA